MCMDKDSVNDIAMCLIMFTTKTSNIVYTFTELYKTITLARIPISEIFLRT